MQTRNDLKELSKQKCSVKGCKNKAESIIRKVLYCNNCNKIKKGRVESEWWINLFNKK